MDIKPKNVKIGNVELEVVKKLPYFFDPVMLGRGGEMAGRRLQEESKNYLIEHGFDPTKGEILTVTKNRPLSIDSDFGYNITEWCGSFNMVSSYGSGVRVKKNISELVNKYIDRHEEKGLVLVTKEVEKEIGLVASFEDK